MRKIMATKYILSTILCVMFLGGCYSDTVDSFKTITVDIPLYFHSFYVNKIAPDTSIDFSNLYSYEEYRKNKGMIDASEIFQFNYWIDSMHIDNDIPFNPVKDTVIFDFIRFYLCYAIPKNDQIAQAIKYLEENGQPDDPFALDSANYMPDTAATAKKYLLGEFLDVNVSEYYRLPHNIRAINEEVAKIISDLCKTNPKFYVITEYSETKEQQPGTDRLFPLVWPRYDMMLRLKIKL